MRRYYPPTASDVPLHGWYPYDEFHRERVRAHAKHDDNGESMERKDFEDASWLSVLVEEVGEVARAHCEHRHRTQAMIQGVMVLDADHKRDRLDPEHRRFRSELRAELIQCGAAMIAAWIEAIDEDRCGAELKLTKPSPEGDTEVHCCLLTAHESSHLDWSGRHRWV